jgi:hypothetical protein
MINAVLVQAAAIQFIFMVFLKLAAAVFFLTSKNQLMK